MLTDTHCHFEDERYDQDRENIIKANLEEMAFVVNVTADPDKLETVAGLIQAHDKIYGALGVHPHYALKNSVNEIVCKIEAVLEFSSNNIVAIGECGLDY